MVAVYFELNLNSKVKLLITWEEQTVES